MTPQAIDLSAAPYIDVTRAPLCDRCKDNGVTGREGSELAADQPIEWCQCEAGAKVARIQPTFVNDWNARELRAVIQSLIAGGALAVERDLEGVDRYRVSKDA